MKRYLTIACFLWAHLSLAAGNDGGIVQKRKLFLVSIGFSNQPDAKPIRESGPDGLKIQQFCPTCQTDATVLSQYFNGLSKTPASEFDSIFVYSFTDGKTTLDKLFSVFEELRKRIGVNDYFVFYYSSSCWMTKKAEGGVEWEAYYGLNSGLFEKQDVDQGAFTLRHLKVLTDRLLSDNQLIIFDSGNGRVIQNDFYRNFFSDNIWESGFTRKNRIILCPETASWETRDDRDGLVKGDMVRVISSLPKELNILTLLEVDPRQTNNDQQFQGVFESDKRSRFKLFMQLFWSEQLNAYAQIKILREREYLDLLGRIKSKNSSGKRGFKSNTPEGPADASDSLSAKRSKKALIVATNTYDSPLWDKLKNPLKDGDSIANVLASKFGYSVNKVYNGSREDILQAIDKLADESLVNPYNQYVVYFAGHGFYDPRQKAGYLVCKDSRTIIDIQRPGTIELSTYIDYSTLFRRLGTDLNRVVMFVDVCFGGASYNTFPGTQEPVDPSQEQKKEKQPFKKVLASGVTEVDDFVRTEEGGISQNSPFAALVLRAFRNGKTGSLDFDGVYGTLISSEPKLKPKPVQFAFGKTALSGEFVF